MTFWLLFLAGWVLLDFLLLAMWAWVARKREPARWLDQRIADEGEARMSLWPTSGRDVMAVPKDREAA